jgi:hypothetical protein
LHSNLEFLEDAGMGIDYGFPVVYSPWKIETYFINSLLITIKEKLILKAESKETDICCHH